MIKDRWFFSLTIGAAISTVTDAITAPTPACIPSSNWLINQLLLNVL